MLHDNAAVLYEGTSYGWTRALERMKGGGGGGVGQEAAPCASALASVSESQCDSWSQIKSSPYTGF